MPRIHVAVVGIEKVIPRFDDLSVFLRILPRSGTGQKQTAYVSFLNGPRRPPSQSGGQPAARGGADFEFHLVLMDNGRTRMLADEQLRESLYCIPLRRLSECMPRLPEDRRASVAGSIPVQLAP